MSRLTFILGITLLFIAGAAIFMITFDRDLAPQQAGQTKATRVTDSTASRTSRSPRPTSRTSSSRSANNDLALQPSATTHLTAKEQNRANDILKQTQREARQKLDQLSRKYQLSKDQRRQALPYILAHHENAHPAMTLNGDSLPSIATGTTLEDSLASFLDPNQQDALVEATIDDEAWWQDVVGQLESDLDTAIDNGEMVPADDDATSTGPVLTDTPAAGDGEASEHSGGNLFDLLGR